MQSAEIREAKGRTGRNREPTPDAHVGARLRARRQEMGLSQAELGRRLGVTFSQVQKYEKGSNRIGAGRLFRLSAILGVTIQYFFEGLDERAAPEPEAIDSVELARLRDAYARIQSPQMRQALLSLASSMAQGD